MLIASAADALGAAQAVMDLAIDYAKVRRQFDAPIGSFQAVQHLCVDMYETVELARSGVIHALWAADAADAAERHLSALRAKAFAGRLATVGDTAIQVFGGIGFTWEHDAHLYLKRLLGWSALLGGSDRYLEAVGRSLASERRGRDLTCPEMLRGVRVVELASWTYVPAAGAALADWGADVIKVEDVRGGDPGRCTGDRRLHQGGGQGARRLHPGDREPRQAQHRHRRQVRRRPGVLRPTARHRGRLPDQLATRRRWSEPG